MEINNQHVEIIYDENLKTLGIFLGQGRFIDCIDTIEECLTDELGSQATVVGFNYLESTDCFNITVNQVNDEEDAVPFKHELIIHKSPLYGT